MKQFFIFSFGDLSLNDTVIEEFFNSIFMNKIKKQIRLKAKLNLFKEIFLAYHLAEIVRLFLKVKDIIRGRKEEKI